MRFATRTPPLWVDIPVFVRPEEGMQAYRLL